MSVPALGRVLAVSPHLDDAVLSAGALLSAQPGSIVLTVFAGIPASYDGLTEWDADSGFSAGSDVVSLRRIEDERATARLGARARWLEFVDSQYRDERPVAETVAAAVRAEVAALDVDTFALPLGFGHGDHERTHEACALLLAGDFGLVAHWIAWADSPYRARHPDLLASRIKSLQADGFALDPFEVDTGESKRAALAEYPSQLRALGVDSVKDAERPEQFFVITRR